MATIALFRKHKQAPELQKRERASDSLDFRDIAPAVTPGALYAAKPKKAPAARIVVAEPAPKSRSIVLPAAIAAAIALGIAYMNNEPAVETPAPVKATPAPVQHAPAYVAPRAPKPAVTATITPPQPPAPRVNIPAVPTAFLEPFQAYTTEAGSKAIALALDKDGRFAHAVVARHAVQAEANGEALADCERYRAQAGIQQPCRLFAVGDRIVW